MIYISNFGLCLSKRMLRLVVDFVGRMAESNTVLCCGCCELCDDGTRQGISALFANWLLLLLVLSSVSSIKLPPSSSVSSSSSSSLGVGAAAVEQSPPPRCFLVCIQRLATLSRTHDNISISSHSVTKYGDSQNHFLKALPLDFTPCDYAKHLLTLDLGHSR